jgi:hypothetical protein
MALLQKSACAPTKMIGAIRAMPLRPLARAAAAPAARRGRAFAPTRAAAAQAPAAEETTLQSFTTQNRNEYFTRRQEVVQRYFPTSLGVEDFVSRVEIALSAFGFNGNNSIGEPPPARGLHWRLASEVLSLCSQNWVWTRGARARAAAAARAEVLGVACCVR